MSDGITDAVSYDQRAFDDWKRREIESFLSKMTVKELCDELAKRDGVKPIEIPKHTCYSVNKDSICGAVTRFERIPMITGVNPR